MQEWMKGWQCTSLRISKLAYYPNREGVKGKVREEGKGEGRERGKEEKEGGWEGGGKDGMKKDKSMEMEIIIGWVRDRKIDNLAVEIVH